MIQAIARKIDQFMHNRAEQRDLNSLWGFSYWRRAVRTAGVMTLDAAAMFAAFMLLILLTRSEAESARLLSPEIGMIVVGVASVLFLAAGMYQRSWRFVSFADSVSMVITSSIGLFCGWIAVGYFWGLPAAGKYFQFSFRSAALLRCHHGDAVDACLPACGTLLPPPAAKCAFDFGQ